MNNNEDAYILTWHTNHGWDCHPATRAVVESIFAINDVQHMLERRCACGATTKMVSRVVSTPSARIHS